MPDWFSKDGRVISHEKPIEPIKYDYIRVEYVVKKQNIFRELPRKISKEKSQKRY